MIHKRFLILSFLGLFVTIAATASAERPLGRARLPGTARLPIAVRVFDGGAFVGNLELKDFEVLESGSSTVPEALFLVQKGQIERREGAADVRPDLSRKMMFLFQLYEYPRKLGEAIDYIFTYDLMPGDALEIQTPVRNYQLSAQHLAAKPRNVLAEELTKIVRKDIMQGNTIYNSLLRELKTVVRLVNRQATPDNRTGDTDTEGEVDSNTALELQLMNYKENMQKMEGLRVLNENNLAAFAGKLRNLPGQKFVFHFYQREFRPEINSNALSVLVMANQDRPDIVGELQTVFQMYNRPINLDYQKLKQLYADSMTNVNFLFMNKEPERAPGITMREQSEDVFKAMSTIAEATGGIVDSSQNPAASIKTAMKAAESYYILFFTSSASAPPGTFLDLKVKVKGRNYKVVHPAGYFSRS